MKADLKNKPKANKSGKFDRKSKEQKPKSLVDLKKKLGGSTKPEEKWKGKLTNAAGKAFKPSSKLHQKSDKSNVKSDKPHQKSDYKGNKPSAPKKTNEAPNYSHKPYAKLVDQMKVPWNRLREHSTPAEVKKTAVNDLLKAMQGHVMDVTLRHDASRLVQAILQFGDQTQQDQILTELNPKFADVCKSPYGHFVILKAIMYCNEKSQIKKICQSVSSQFVSLGTHVIGARVVETILQLYPHTLTRSLKAEFYGKKFSLLLPEQPKSLHDLITSLPQKSASILDHMRDLMHKLIQKQLTTFVYVHNLLWEYMQEITPQNISLPQLLAAEQDTAEGLESGNGSKSSNPLHRMTDLVSTLIDSAPKLLATRAGAKVMVLVITFTPAKDRKRILKSLKGHVLESLTHAADAAWMGILRLVDVVDDTVLLQKSLFDELNKSETSVVKYAADGTQLGEISAPWLQIMRHRSGHKLLLRLCTPSRRHIDSGDDVDTLFATASPYSKKSDTLRRKEHFVYIKAVVQRVMSHHLETLVRCRHGSKVVASWYEAAMPVDLLEGLAPVFCGQQATIMDAEEEEEQADEMDIDEDEEENEDDIETVPEEDAEELDDDDAMDEDRIKNEDGDVEEEVVEEKEYQQLLEEAAADQNRKNKAINSKAAEVEVISDLPIEEDPTAHVLLKRLLRFETAFIYHHAELQAAELNTSQQQIVQSLKQFAQLDKDSKPNSAKEDEVIAQVIQDSTLRGDDIGLSLEEGLVQLRPTGLGQRIMDYLQQDDNALLVQWLQCNRACFILNELFKQPLFFEQMLHVLSKVDANILTSALEATGGGKVLAKLHQTRLQLEAEREAAKSGKSAKKQTPAKGSKKGKGKQ